MCLYSLLYDVTNGAWGCWEAPRPGRGNGQANRPGANNVQQPGGSRRLGEKGDCNAQEEMRARRAARTQEGQDDA